MKLFKPYTYQWWELGVFKVALLLLGIAIGAYWQEAFLPYVALLAAGGVVLGFYVMYISFRQQS